MKLKEFTLVGTLAPGAGNPRNSEGSFLPLEDGRIAYAYSRFTGGSWDDDATCDIAVVYSHDGGRSFDTDHVEILVTAAEYGVRNVMGATLRRMNNGDIGLFYGKKEPWFATEKYLRRYRGDFSHLVGEVKCFPFAYESYLCGMCDRVLRRSDGAWMIPMALYHSNTEHKSAKLLEEGTYLDFRGSICFFVSEDDGATWKEQHTRLYMPDPYSDRGLTEAGLVELPNGVLYCYCRTDRMYQYEAFSMDWAHWTTPQPSRFTSPDSPMLIKRNPYSGKYYAVWNPAPRHQARVYAPISAGRTPYVMAESEDGVNFSAPVILEDDPNRGFCYPAMEFLDEKTMLLAYCCGGVEDGSCLNRTAIRYLTLEEET